MTFTENSPIHIELPTLRVGQYLIIENRLAEPIVFRTCPSETVLEPKAIWKFGERK
jgi:hypothetical protein